jgi:hypothetical protein
MLLGEEAEAYEKALEESWNDEPEVRCTHEAEGDNRDVYESWEDNPLAQFEESL